MLAIDEKITLESWKQKTIAEMEEFIKEWRDKGEVNKEYYPDKLTLGEWDEQFQFYASQAYVKNEDEEL